MADSLPTLRPFKEMMALGKEKMREVMAGPRSAFFKSKAERELAEIEMEIITLRSKVEEMFYAEDAYKNFDFKAAFDIYDNIALLERRKEQYETAIAQLFPKDDAA